MILRRITEHVKTENWFAVGIDFVIVVIGVFVGDVVNVLVNNGQDRRLSRHAVCERPYFMFLGNQRWSSVSISARR